jgi:hypothetical protein
LRLKLAQEKEALSMSPLSFAQDIRPMFRDFDIEEMKQAADFDLSKYEDVCANAASIHARMEDGSMPCDAAISDEQIAKFKQWMDDGMKA